MNFKRYEYLSIFQVLTEIQCIFYSSILLKKGTKRNEYLALTGRRNNILIVMLTVDMVRTLDI